MKCDDLLVEIFLCLPVKPLAIFLCPRVGVMFASPDLFTLSHWHFFTPSHPSLVINETYCVDNTPTRLIICNPALGKGVVLPRSGSYKPYKTWYMGYDPISFQYKVLFLSKECLNCSWKVIEVGNIHSPVTKGICIEGVVYYGAHTEHGHR
ncbi:hypothetical protein CARUB_v10006755mg [Capsella rubella]|uniref:F-box associated beta-propeller type 3 domain-containing protein n=1 Tax=Capsella rubella TaxID=81985 RepID=R0F8J0_9BRAS|nr:hypothetical protein CARUB_v10006755mg [Capsella rubella]